MVNRFHIDFRARTMESNKRCEDSTEVSKALNSPCENICNEASPGCFSLSSSYAPALHKMPAAPSTHLTHPERGKIWSRTLERIQANGDSVCVFWDVQWTCKFVAFVTWLQVRNAFPPLLILINMTITLREIGHFAGWIPLTVSDSLAMRLRASPPEVMCPWVHHRHSQQRQQPRLWLKTLVESQT